MQNATETYYILSFVYQTKERTKEKFTSVVFLFPLKLPKNWEPRKPALLCKAKSRLFFQFFTKFFGKNKGGIFSSLGEYLKPPVVAAPQKGSPAASLFILKPLAGATCFSAVFYILSHSQCYPLHLPLSFLSGRHL